MSKVAFGEVMSSHCEACDLVSLFASEMLLKSWFNLQGFLGRVDCGINENLGDFLTMETAARKLNRFWLVFELSLCLLLPSS